MEESQVTTAEQNRDDMNNFFQELLPENDPHSSVESESVIQMNLS